MPYAGPAVPAAQGREPAPAATARSSAGTTVAVEAARRGDELAFALLYDAYARMVHGILLARVPAAEVDDLVHGVFINAWRRLESLREPAAFGKWLAAIARKMATDFHRRAVPSAEFPEQLIASDPSSARAEALAILAAIRTMPDACRETLVLRLVEGMTGAEIAERTGLTAGSVRVHLHRGLKLLRERLGR